MSNQGLGISGMVADDDDSAAFDPLMFLADVAIQDAMQNTSLQDMVMQDAGTDGADMQDTVSPKADTQDTNTMDVNTQDTTRADTAKQEDLEGDSEEGLTREVVTADQFLSMLAGPSSTTTDPSLPMLMDSDDEDADNNNSDYESDTTVKGEPDAKDKDKSRARQKKSAEERAKETAARVENMTQQRAEDEQQVLKEMRRDEAMNRLAAESGTGSTSLNEIEATGILPEDAVLIASLLDHDSEEESDREELVIVGSKHRLLCQGKDAETEIVRKKFNLFSQLSNYLELFMELAKHLRINDLVSLYAISKDFNETLNGHLSHILKACAAYQAPESSRIFVFTLYRSLCIHDPVGRPDPTNPALARMVPSLRWLRMVIHREKCVRDILACMAREGHRMPKTMSLSLKKMWLTMDIPTSARRVQLMHNENYWTDNDLYNLQMFFIKLDMRFNDPIEGPADDGLRKLMLGQRGLTPLCQLLKRTRFTDSLEVLEACVRYSYWPRPEHRHLPILGVPANEVGRGHLEGWGVGQVHLYRLDELVMRESCRRNMDLKSHLYTMICWGYVDSDTGKNIEVTREERYMSDDDVVVKKKREKGKLPCGERKTKKDKCKGKEANDDGEKKGDDKDGHTKKNKKSKDGDGDVRMAG
jgi:hypothetical protein